MTDTRWTDEADFLVDVPISSFSNRLGSCLDEVLQQQSVHVHCMKAPLLPPLQSLKRERKRRIVEIWLIFVGFHKI